MNLKKFIKDLKKQGKIKLIEKSEEVSYSYELKSQSSLKSSKILIKNSLLEDSISMSYYSMYNKLLSLFYKIGLKSENHFFSIFVLKEIFGFENKERFLAKKERIKTQYYSNFKLTKENAKKSIITAEEFNANLGFFIDNLSLKEITIYRIKFKELLR